MTTVNQIITVVILFVVENIVDIFQIDFVNFDCIVTILNELKHKSLPYYYLQSPELFITLVLSLSL
jgi:hypothetical protein